MKLIPAYNWVSSATETVLEQSEQTEYLKISTIASDIKSVRKIIKSYRKTDIRLEIREFLDLYLSNIALLAKTQIVNDCSYRNSVILVRPDRISQNGRMQYQYSYPKWPNILTHYLNNAETIFIVFSSERWYLHQLKMKAEIFNGRDYIYENTKGC